MQRPAAQPAEQRADCSRLAMQGGRAAGGWELCMAQIPDAVKWVLTSCAGAGRGVPKRWVEVAAQRAEQRVECSRLAMQCSMNV